MAAIPAQGFNFNTISSIRTRTLLGSVTQGAPTLVTDGRVFELLDLIVTNTSVASVLRSRLYDANETTAPSTNARMIEVRVAPGDTVKLNWPRGSGLRFRTNPTMDKADGNGTAGFRTVAVTGLLH
mgnify:CR=1 FL=1